MRFGKETLTSTSIIIGYGPLDREQTKQEGDSGGPSTSAVDNTVTPKHITGGVHFTVRSLREEDYGDDCRKALGSTKDDHCRERTAGCP